MKPEIASIGLTRLTLAAHSEFHDLVADQINFHTDPTILHLEILGPKYTEAVKAEGAAINRPTAFSETPEMVEENHARDLAVSQCFNIMNTYIKSPFDTEIDAARRIHAIMAPYKGIQKHEYNRKTAEIDGLILSLSAAKPADITLLNLTSAIAHARMPISETDSSELRYTTDELYHEIVKRINAYSIVMPSVDLEVFVLAVNALIIQYKHVIANQGKGRKKTEEVGEPEEDNNI